MVWRFNLGVFYDLWPPFWPTYNKKIKKRKVDSSATFLRRIQICFQNRKIPILKFWPPIGGPLVTPWPLTSVVESSPTLFWPSKSVRWKVRTLSLMYFLCMSQLQKKRLKLGHYQLPYTFCPRRNTIPTRTIIRGGWVSSSSLLSSLSTLLKMG